MSFQVDTALVQAYHANITIKFQQKVSRLRPWVRVENQSAEYDYYDRIGPTDPVEVTTRHGDTPLIPTPHDRRRVGLRDFDWADLIDRKDKIRMLADPTSPYTVNAVMGFGRKMDDVIIDAAFGTAYTGKTGATAVTFPAGNIIAVNYVDPGGTPANTNLTVAKLRKVRQMFDAAEAAAEDEADLVMVVDPMQILGLLTTTQVTSSDYNVVKALYNGEVDTYMGFKFIKTNRLTKSGNNRLCLAFERQGLLLAIGTEIVTDVGPRRDKRNSVQVYVSASIGSVRMWEEKVIQVLCDETAVST